MSPKRYRRAQTLRERRRRVLLGLALTPVVLLLLVSLLAAFSLIDHHPTGLSRFLITASLVLVPVAIGIAAEFRVGRSYAEDESPDPPMED